MNGNTELLNFVYQNAQMGVVTLKQLMELAHGEDFRSHMEAQLREYETMEAEAVKLLEEHGCDEKGLSAFEKIRTYLMIDLQTLTDKSASHVAEMMLIGSTMGVINALRNLRKYEGAEKRIRDLMDRLLKFEERNMEQLKKFV